MKIEELYQANHGYYCNDGNYYSNDCVFEFDCFSEFVDEMGTSDMDYNLLFRWDVKLKYDEDGNDIQGEYQLFLYWMQQRKGRFVVNVVSDFKQEDVEGFLTFVKPRWEHLKSLWTPFA